LTLRHLPHSIHLVLVSLIGVEGQHAGLCKFSERRLVFILVLSNLNPKNLSTSTLEGSSLGREEGEVEVGMEYNLDLRPFGLLLLLDHYLQLQLASCLHLTGSCVLD
jgi:hypothetical protein